MVLVAIPGGSSPTLGRSIVTAVQGTGRHEVVILSRAKSKGEEEGDGNVCMPFVLYFGIHLGLFCHPLLENDRLKRRE
jgi:hypothetical protein